MTHPEILKTERLGSRQIVAENGGCCRFCGKSVRLCRDEHCFGFDGELFCSESCLHMTIAGRRRRKLTQKGNSR